MPLHAKAAKYLAMVREKVNKHDPLRPNEAFLGQRLIAFVKHGDRRTMLYTLVLKCMHDRMVQGKASLLSKSLKVEEDGSYLIHQTRLNQKTVTVAHGAMCK